MPKDEHDHLVKRLEQLERQSEQLDVELRRLRRDLLRHKSAAAVSAAVSAPPAPSTPPPEAVEPVAPEPTAPPPPAAEAGRKREAIDVEFWLGGRGLLLIGVAAGVFAVGFFVKEAIERGWIGPTIRVLLGAGLGVVAAVVGDQIRARGYRIYGLWLAAGGFSAIYLSLWAAATLYALLPTGAGFALMVVVVAAAAVLGLLRSSESFVALAAVGGYLAPVLLQMESASVLFGLGYLGLLTGTGLWLAYREGWLYLAVVAVLGGTIMALLSEGEPHLHGTYLALLVAGALVTAERRRWPGLAILAAVFGWLTLLVGSGQWEITAVSFCAYAAALAAAGLGIAARAGWAGLGAVTVAGGTLVILSNVGAPDAHGIYLLALGAAALILARRERWVEIALLTIVLTWAALWLGRDGWNMLGLQFSLYAGGLWLISLIASLGLDVSDIRPAERSEESEEGKGSTAGEVDLIEAVRTLIGPQASGVLVTVLPPWLFYLYAMVGLEDSAYAESRGAIGFGLGLVIGCVYLAQTVWGTKNLRATRLTWLAGLGYAFWLVAPSLLWEGAALARVFLLEGLALVAAGVLLRTVEARAASLAAFVLAAMTYYGAAVIERPELDAAFVGAWALTALAVAVGLAVWGVAVERVESPASWESGIRPIVLLVAAVLFLGWGTVEIQRFFELLGEGDRWNLARDLSISGFWMAYAAVLLVFGFWLKRPPVRWVGLGMALLAAGKVFLYDLSQLSQLYRISSFVALAIVLLALSFRYQKLRGADKEADS
ncbi:MAG: DUF2339 domain-containing protein [Gemmatimonadetes bacterium]|nr:DUF2339 domain-containing protein [Gemmatimonadota bacterium]NIO31722.1 DUF2339 domain-containing protein [Gemmatimonadota bacterium]